jgi:hypothetical protein
VVQRRGIEDLRDVAAHVLGCQELARALTNSHPVVLVVLELAKLSGRRELPMVAVADSGVGQQGLQSPGVGPREVRAADPATLAHVHQQRHLGIVQGLQEGVGGEAVDADRGQRGHRAHAWA